MNLINSPPNPKSLLNTSIFCTKEKYLDNGSESPIYRVCTYTKGKGRIPMHGHQEEGTHPCAWIPRNIPIQNLWKLLKFSIKQILRKFSIRHFIHKPTSLIWIICPSNFHIFSQLDKFVCILHPNDIWLRLIIIKITSLYPLVNFNFMVY